MPQSFTCLHNHPIFGTKHRLPMITPDLQPRLYEYLGGILRAADGCLLARLSKQPDGSAALRLIKANSSKWVHQTFADGQQFAWQDGYGAFSVSYSHLPRVKAYLAGQPGTPSHPDVSGGVPGVPHAVPHRVR